MLDQFLKPLPQYLFAIHHENQVNLRPPFSASKGVEVFDDT